MEYCIETEDLRKTYPNGYTALEGVSFKIRKGDIVGYLGPNGAGKTTTIKILTDLIRPSSGSAYVMGIDVNENPKAALGHIGSLIEVPGVYDFLTPRKMLTYFGRVHGMDRSSIEHRIKEVLAQVNIDEWTDRKIGGFSTGMQRRLAIAKAVLNEPEIVILDEPVLGLDPKGIRDIRELIKQFQAEGMTVFLSSHMLQEVSETCDRVVLIMNGQIMAHDTIPNIRNRLEASVIEVGFMSPITDKMVTTVEAIQGVDSVEKNNGHLRLHFDGSSENCRGILAAMLSSGLDVVSYTPWTRGLEEFYLSVIDRVGRGEVS